MKRGNEVIGDVEDNRLNKKKKKNHIPFRLNVLFLIIFLAFSTLILRLGYVQIVHGEDYVRELKKTQTVTTKIQSPRGLMYDTKGRLLVGNTAKNALVFTRKPDQDLIKLAKKLSRYLDVSTKENVSDGDLSTSQVTVRDMKDYWIATHPKIYEEKLSADEYEKYKKASDAKEKAKMNAYYDKVLARIGEKELGQLTTDDLKVIAIWRKLEQGTNLTPTYVKIGLSQDELARIGEHLNEFDGTIDTSVASTRTYPEGHFFFLGNIKEIPRHEVDNYLADGYNRNDLVGTSNLEQQYEDILRGVPMTYTYKKKNGKPVGTPKKVEGRRGDDLVLTIDADLQKKIGDILENRIREFLSSHARSAYAVVMNPHTGGILAMVGRTYDPATGKFKDTSEGTILNAFQFGSSVKGATVLTGFQNHAVPAGRIVDKPFRFNGGGKFSSFTSGIGAVNVTEALEHSSNIFMGTIAGRMAGFQFADVGSAYKVRVFNGPKYVHAVHALRDGYNQFGLGVHTGVDLPFESTGYNGGVPDQPGKIMQFAIGQFDTYTPLQMAQYVSTIANGGKRIAPHLLESVHAPGDDPKKIGPTIKTYPTKVLNTVANTKQQIDLVHEGFYLVTHGSGGTAKSLGTGVNAKYKIAGKTGTAQLAPIERGLYNLAFIGYAPYDNPQVAVAIIAPETRENHVNLYIAQDIFKTYFSLYPDQLKD